MEALLQFLIMFFVTGFILVAAIFYLAPHLIMLFLIRFKILISSFRKKNILLKDDLWCSYLERGDIYSSSESILFLHSFTGSAIEFIEYGHHLNKSTHIICIDLLNHGDSSSFSRVLEPNEMMEFVHQFVLKNCLHQRKFHIAGISMGGWISILYASKYCEYIASLILISPAGLVQIDDSKNELAGITSDDGTMAFKTNEDVKKLLRYFSSGDMKIPPDFIITLLRHFINHASVKLSYVFKGLVKSGKIEVSRLAPLTNIKVMVIQGDKDVVTPKAGADFFLDHVPHTELHIIKNGSHLICATHFDEVCGFMKKWMEV